MCSSDLEIVGVVSRGRSCFTEGNHVYTRIDAYATLARQAFAEARKSEKDEHVAAVAPTSASHNLR